MNKKKLLLLLATLAGCQKKPQPIKQKPTKLKKEEKKVPILPSGLKTQILQAGPPNAPRPEIGNTISVHYTGWLAKEDGTAGRQIDSSLERNTPLEFIIGLEQVIKGFEEGIKQMRVGEKRRLFIDSELGYGKNGVGLFIPPDSNLIFDVELLNVR